MAAAGLMVATSNSISGTGGISFAMSGRFAVGVRSTLSTTVAGCGTSPGAITRPSCLLVYLDVGVDGVLAGLHLLGGKPEGEVVWLGQAGAIEDRMTEVAANGCQELRQRLGGAGDRVICAGFDLSGAP